MSLSKDQILYLSLIRVCLMYLGLPGITIRDTKDWKDFLGCSHLCKVEARSVVDLLLSVSLDHK